MMCVLISATAALCTLLSASPVFAQGLSPQIEWQLATGGKQGDVPLCIARTFNGSVTVGYSYSNDGDVTGHRGDTTASDFWIVNLDRDGVVQWHESVGGLANDVAESIVQSNDGGYYLTGTTISNSSPDVSGNHGNTDCWIARLNSVGTLQWSRCYGGPGRDASHAVILTSDGGVVFAGSSSGVGGDVSVNHGAEDVWVVKIDGNGTIQWQRSFGGSGTDIARAIQETSDHGFIIAGESTSPNDGDVTGHHGAPSPANVDAWLMKLTKDGNLVWQKSLGGSADDRALNVVQSRDGGYVMVGGSQSSDGDVPSNAGFKYAWIAKVNASGNLVWSKTYGGSNYDIASGVVALADGGFAVSGITTSGPGTNPFNLTGGSDAWVAELDSMGNKVWANCYGGASAENGSWNDEVGYEEGSSIVDMNGQGFVFAVSTRSFGGHGNAQNPDYWIVKLFTGPVIQSGQDFTMSPAPCDTVSMLSFDVCNDGEGPLTISSAYFTGAASSELQIVQPASFPHTIETGHCSPFRLKRTPTTDGNKIDSLWLVNDDPTPNHNPWIIVIIRPQGSIGCAIDGVAQDTIDLGILRCAAERDTAFGITNTSSSATSFSITNDNIAEFQTGLPVITMNQGERQLIRVVFTGSAVAGVHFATCTIRDSCDRQHTVVVRATVDSATLLFTALRDTTICPQAGFSRDVMIRSASPLLHHFLSTARVQGPFYITPDSATLAAGDSTVIRLTFTGGTVGTYPVVFTFVDECGGQHVLGETVHVDTASIIAESLPDFETCVGDSIVIRLHLNNISSGDQTVHLSPDNPLFTVTPDTIVIPANDSADVTLTFAGTQSSGTETAHIALPGCTGANMVTAIVLVHDAGLTASSINDTAVCPGSQVTRRLVLHNRSANAQTVQLAGDNAAFSIAPGTLTIPAGDSAAFTIVYRGSTMARIDSVHCSYRDDCNVVHVMTVRVAVDTMSVAADAIADTVVCPGASAVREVVIRNLSSAPQTVRCTGNNPQFVVSPDSLVLAPGDSGRVMIAFQGSPVLGAQSVTISYTDNCGIARTIAMRITIDSAGVIAESIADTTICTGTSIRRRVAVRNVSGVTQQFQLIPGDTLFTVVPPNLVLAPGDSAVVVLTFAGSDTGGRHDAHVSLPGCGAGAIGMRVQVDGPMIGVPRILNATVCPNSIATIAIPIANGDSIPRTVAIGDSNCSASVASLTIPPRRTDTVVVTVPVGAAGTSTATVRITDDCGTVRTVVMNIIAANLPPMVLSMHSGSDSAAIGNVLRAFVIATPAPSVAGGGITMTVQNEPTALMFDSASSAGAITVVRGNNAVTISLGAAPFATDTLATLYYRALAGSTLAPWLILRDVSTSSTCQSVTGGDTVSIALAPPGCELGTLTVRPYTTAINSVYPNPATGMTTIAYSTVEDAAVRLELWDQLGRRLKILAGGDLKPGAYSALVNFDALANGTYTLVLRAGTRIAAREMLILK